MVPATKLNVALGARSYPIFIGRGLLDDAAQWREHLRGKHVLIVSNEVVAPLYLERVRASLSADVVIASLLLADGEAHKTLESTARIFSALAELKAGRDATIVALGGGVTGDIAGFAAACWMRGIDFVQIPTTLLAMVDSSVGGKTGVDLAQGKNLVGAFHQPRAVVIDTDTLATLPQRELRAGFAEVIKYGALGDAQFFAWLESNAQALIEREPASIAHAIALCCAHKAEIVARDEHEHGERALLNFGHTFGHALETDAGYATLLHGEAVAVGMLLAARLSSRLQRAPAVDADRLQNLLARFGLPTRIGHATNAQRLLGLMQLDKKNRAGRLRLILWRGIGQAEIVSDLQANDIVAAIDAAIATGN